MTQQEILNTYKKISVFLSKKQLKDSFDALDLLLQTLQNWSFFEKKIELENTYKLMLQYAVDGVQDIERYLIYNKLITSIYALADEAKEALLLKVSSNYEYQQMRNASLLPAVSLQKITMEIVDSHVNLSLTELVESEESKAQKNIFRKKYEEQQTALFNKVRLTQYFSKDEYQVLQEMIKNTEINVEDKSLIISALTLNILRNFDENKIFLLFDFYAQPQEELRQRALIGLMLAMYIYDDRMPLYPAIRNRLVIESDNDEFKKNISLLIALFISSKETENITKKLREEIFPEMMKISPLLENKIDMENISNMEDFEEKNPDWHEIIEQSGVGDKIKELNDMQLEGADVFMTTFSSLKHFPFFSTMSNWFLPFDYEHSALQGIFEPDEKSFLTVLMHSGYMCNSDKYSFCLSMSKISESQKKKMSSSFQMEAEQVEEMKNEEIANPLRHKKTLANQYLQDLYRFYKLYNHRNSFTDVFSLPLDFHNTWFYKNIGFNQDDLRKIAESYFLKNRYKEALEIFLRLLDEQKNNAELYQKTGYCFQHLGNIEKALENYLLAETILGDCKWTIRRIAFSYRMLKNYAKALEYYKRLQSLDPDNLTIQMNIGHCLLAMGNYKDALNAYFKIDVLSPDNPKAWRAVAWCSFLSKKFPQAQKYYAKLVGKKPVHNDFINAGHTEWAVGNRPKALEYYAESIKQNKGNLPEFLSIFQKDIPDLISVGIKDDEIPIMIDRLKYIMAE
jgi:tetratricopeptide (TPR) repeat protein